MLVALSVTKRSLYCPVSHSVDITVYRNGYHGDLNETFYIGEVDEGARKLVQTTFECLMQAIDSGKGRSLLTHLSYLGAIWSL